MSNESALKAKLKIQLYADTLLIAESNNTELWQNIFAAIQSGGISLEDKQSKNKPDTSEGIETPKGKINGIQGFAHEVGITEEDIIGACSPSLEPPYLHLDEHYWESLRKNTPPRGPSAIAPVPLAATLLSMWFKYSGIDGNPSVRQCHDVLKTIKVQDKNAARSLKNSNWLQKRPNGIVINPSLRSKAVQIAKAYCTRKSPSDLD